MGSLTPASLFTQTADVRTFKTGLSDLEVFVSLGGWAFSDSETATQPTFGDIARTESNRQAFANNLVDFMKKYGFDGVDLDWEYDSPSHLTLLRYRINKLVSTDTPGPVIEAAMRGTPRTMSSSSRPSERHSTAPPTAPTA
ncbi:glycoside hydrolase superfamily [Aspergillus granulosus]|uniref:Glycoside hydrolase superfamily n=1 Tax=Aspergillus granulosus TaxID=176169 RepID=A0ABR4GX89_9EURO